LAKVALLIAALSGIGTVAGCTSNAGTMATQVSDWASGATVISNDQLVVQDIAALQRSVKEGLIRYVTTNCAGLVTDAGTAYGNLPAPDNTLTDELNVAYEDFANAGSRCATAQNVHSRKVTGALRTISEGVVSLDAATRRLASYGVR
jgi:hypothetical protein